MILYLPAVLLLSFVVSLPCTVDSLFGKLSEPGFGKIKGLTGLKQIDKLRNI
jgi:hypothetical protein